MFASHTSRDAEHCTDPELSQPGEQVISDLYRHDNPDMVEWSQNLVTSLRDRVSQDK